MRRVCVLTGSRADYGLLAPTMRALDAHHDYELKVIASAMHLSPLYGDTIQEIEADGFTIDARVPMLSDDNSPKGTVKSMAMGLEGFADALSEVQPDLVMILGDRFEALVAAEAAATMNIPIAHLHGGELTFGAIDESYRHAITKLSHLHFTSTEEYRHRVIRMGEQPHNCYNVGATAIEAIKTLPLMYLKSLSKSIDFDLTNKFFIITYHPVTQGNSPDSEALKSLLDALDAFPDYRVLITFPNADAESAQLIEILESYVASNKEHAYLTPSLGHLRYLSAGSLAIACIGNSSSGILEMPSLGTPTVNIGTRQQGRICASSILHTNHHTADIIKTIKQALSNDAQANAALKQSPYGDGTTSRQILEVLDSTDFNSLNPKYFYDGGDDVS